eukprot:6961596-Pyramimonas_sp.AAC.1
MEKEGSSVPIGRADACPLSRISLSSASSSSAFSKEGDPPPGRGGLSGTRPWELWPPGGPASRD